MAQKLVFREVRCGKCLKLFYLCGPHDCSQAYCRENCREESRARICREANARHQQSEEGRLDHRDRSRAYRARLRERVTDPGREKLAESAKSPSPTPGNQRTADAE